MSIKVAIFEDDPGIIRGLKGYLKDVLGLEVMCFNKPAQFRKIKSDGERIDADVALIDVSFSTGMVDSRTIIQQFLSRDTRRVATSGHGINTVKRDLIQSLEVDHFFSEYPTTYFDQVIRLGKISEEERLLRGFSVGVEGGGKSRKRSGVGAG